MSKDIIISCEVDFFSKNTSLQAVWNLHRAKKRRRSYAKGSSKTSGGTVSGITTCISRHLFFVGDYAGRCYNMSNHGQGRDKARLQELDIILVVTEFASKHVLWRRLQTSYLVAALIWGSNSRKQNTRRLEKKAFSPFSMIPWPKPNLNRRSLYQLTKPSVIYWRERSGTNAHARPALHQDHAHTRPAVSQ